MKNINSFLKYFFSIIVYLIKNIYFFLRYVLSLIKEWHFYWVWCWYPTLITIRYILFLDPDTVYLAFFLIKYEFFYLSHLPLFFQLPFPQNFELLRIVFSLVFLSYLFFLEEIYSWTIETILMLWYGNLPKELAFWFILRERIYCYLLNLWLTYIPFEPSLPIIWIIYHNIFIIFIILFLIFISL